jgi:hypothetical protein
MSDNRFLLYDSLDTYSNDIIQELKNSNLLSTFILVDKKTVDQSKINPIIKKCLLTCKLPTLLVPNTSMPIERDNVKNWIKSVQLFNISTNSIRQKQKVTEPSPHDKMGIPIQEIKKISDSYTFIDDKTTDKSFESPNSNNLILDSNEMTMKVEQDDDKTKQERKLKVLKIIRGKK